MNAVVLEGRKHVQEVVDGFATEPVLFFSLTQLLLQGRRDLELLQVLCLEQESFPFEKVLFPLA